jgi:cystathionine beta-synthase
MHEDVRRGIAETIGNTPLVRLTHIARDTSAEVLAKVESFNPGGSVKDRVGLAMIEDAVSRGLLKPGGTIVEATAGNTGLGLAIGAASKGYRMVFVVPDKMSQEKISLLRAYGAEVVLTATAVPPDHPDYYVNRAKTIAMNTPNSFVPDQFSNVANPLTHYRTTGPEIWRQTNGRLDFFVAGMGTGGTISGVARFLKEQDPRIKIVGVDPQGSVYAEYKRQGTIGLAGSYKVEGIGEEFIPRTMDMNLVDEVVTVTDKDAFITARDLARMEGILAGGSSGAALSVALKIARGLGPRGKGKRIVVLLPDTGRNYLTKIFSDDWMKTNGFM